MRSQRSTAKYARRAQGLVWAVGISSHIYKCGSHGGEKMLWSMLELRFRSKRRIWTLPVWLGIYHVTDVRSYQNSFQLPPLFVWPSKRVVRSDQMLGFASVNARLLNTHRLWHVQQSHLPRFKDAKTSEDDLPDPDGRA